VKALVPRQGYGIFYWQKRILTARTHSPLKYEQFFTTCHHNLLKIAHGTATLSLLQTNAVKARLKNIAPRAKAHALKTLGDIKG